LSRTQVYTRALANGKNSVDAEQVDTSRIETLA
jgi:hypothetical protein